MWLSGFELFDAVDRLDEEHDELRGVHIEHRSCFFDFLDCQRNATVKPLIDGAEPSDAKRDLAF